MAFNIGVSIYCIPARSVSGLLEFVTIHDFGAIELWQSPDLRPDDKIRKFLADANHNLSIHAPLLNLGDPDQMDANLRDLRETIDNTARMRGKTVVLHLGAVPGGVAMASIAIEIAKSVIGSLICLLEQHGILLCIENVDKENELIRDFRHLGEFVDCFPGHLVSIAFDTSHANVVGRVEVGVRELGNRIKHIHLSDNKGNQSDHHWPVGTGNIDFCTLSGICSSKEIDGILEIAPKRHWEQNLLSSRQTLHELYRIGSKKIE